MLSVTQARNTILNTLTPLPSERVFLDEACGRILAADLTARITVPPADNSAMDGYAVRTADITKPGTILQVSGELPAGRTPERALARGEALRIMTGAPVPEGADAVVMREQTTEEPDTVVINTIPGAGDHIRRAGEDIKAGKLLLKAGTRLSPAHIGLAASQGISHLPCGQRPRVAILATGDEVVECTRPLEPGKIYSSNSHTLITLVRELGAEPVYLGIAADTREDLEQKLARAAHADLILTSGGVSMGDYDLVREILAEQRMDFWKVAMKPGKPLAFGAIHGVPAIGLPGNPVSTMVSFYQFARPAILKLMGADSLLLPRVYATLTGDITKKTDRRHYVRGTLTSTPQGLRVTPADAQGSGILSTLAQSSCFIILEQETARAQAGETVCCELFRPWAIAENQED